MNINPLAQSDPAPSELAPPGMTLAELALRLDTILAFVLRLIAAQSRIIGVITVPLWNRISRSRQRLARLLAHLAAGRLPRIRAPRRTTPPAGPRSEPNGAAVMPIPSRPLWLVIKLGYQAAGLGSHLTYLLQAPGVAEVLASSPGAARTLRPLCRLLGVNLPPALQLPPRPRKPRPPNPPRAPKIRAPKVRAPKPALLPLAPQRKPRPLPFLPPFVKFRQTRQA